MTSLRKPLRVNVGFVINSAIGQHGEFDFDIPHFQIDPELLLSSFTGTARFTRTPQGLFVETKFRATTALECVRCLCEYDQPLEFGFEELYAFTRDNVTDAELLVPEDAQIDIQPLVYDEAVLAFPLLPTCSPDCKGLCRECGQNLNEKDCGHDQHSSDSPFSALKELL
jgi:uncharacterized protein